MKHIFCCSLLFLMPLIASEIEETKENKPPKMQTYRQTNPEQEPYKDDIVYQEFPESHKGYSGNTLVEFYLKLNKSILTQKN